MIVSYEYLFQFKLYQGRSRLLKFSNARSVETHNYTLRFIKYFQILVKTLFWAQDKCRLGISLAGSHQCVKNDAATSEGHIIISILHLEWF